ncbi:hypothetical protein MA16_Dca026034 [Dendrobium catenatum]|uniref:Uncharacterized protein n=1 Tax=Dendrobium catenatum TaxID=906689 RepID=A0A2I0VDD1_9ASPA|nr:hypothetical protein MA16_Dca026034 [Dendrobium catenatum]
MVSACGCEWKARMARLGRMRRKRDGLEVVSLSECGSVVGEDEIEEFVRGRGN